MHNDLIKDNQRISSWNQSLNEGTEYDPVVFGPLKKSKWQLKMKLADPTKMSKDLITKFNTNNE